jgi:hypothetical protein
MKTKNKKSSDTLKSDLKHLLFYVENTLIDNKNINDSIMLYVRNELRRLINLSEKHNGK